jgi:hypothetical protein
MTDKRPFDSGFLFALPGQYSKNFDNGRIYGIDVGYRW